MPGPINSVPSVEVEHFSDGPPLGKIAPEGLTSAAPSLPAQAWMDGRAAESRSGTSSALHEVKGVGTTFAMVAGEASGDLFAGLLLDGLSAITINDALSGKKSCFVTASGFFEALKRLPRLEQLG